MYTFQIFQFLDQTINDNSTRTSSLRDIGEFSGLQLVDVSCFDFVVAPGPDVNWLGDGGEVR